MINLTPDPDQSWQIAYALEVMGAQFQGISQLSTNFCMNFLDHSFCLNM